MTINHLIVFLVQNPIFRTNGILIAIKHPKSIIWADPYVRHWTRKIVEVLFLRIQPLKIVQISFIFPKQKLVGWKKSPAKQIFKFISTRSILVFQNQLPTLWGSPVAAGSLLQCLKDLRVPQPRPIRSSASRSSRVSSHVSPSSPWIQLEKRKTQKKTRL